METKLKNSIGSSCNFAVDLTGQVAIVTGAAQGIGKAVADSLAESGASVMAMDQQPVSEEGALAGPANRLNQVTDISQPEEIKESVNVCIQKLGMPDILIHMAGISKPCRIADMAPETWQHLIDVNLHPIYYLTYAVLPHMLERGRGCIVFCSSMIASTGGESSAHYTAAKSGVEGFSRSIAREVGPQGGRVNVVAPGMIDTAMLNLMPVAQKEKLVGRIPLRRMGYPADMVGPVLFLVSDAGAYVTGQTIHVNGGMFMT